MKNKTTLYKKMVYAYYMDYIKHVQANDNFELVFDGYISGHYIMVSELKKNRKIAVVGSFSEFRTLSQVLPLEFFPWYELDEKQMRKEIKK